MKEALLSEALRLVPKHGWTRLTLQEAARALNLPPTAHGLVRGEVDLVAFFIEQSNASLAAAVDVSDDLNLTMREKVHSAAKARLQMVVPFEGSWAQALAVLAAPYNVPQGASLLHATSDEILHVSGDKSTDMSWYTKRALLSLAYSASELYMLTDQSAGKQDTWRFLEQRIGNYASTVQATSQLTKFF
jgi:ubiquinone biosynthesis protein COQ9